MLNTSTTEELGEVVEEHKKNAQSALVEHGQRCAHLGVAQRWLHKLEQISQELLKRYR